MTAAEGFSTSTSADARGEELTPSSSAGAAAAPTPALREAGVGVTPAVPAAVVIDQPGIYDIPADVYHADPVPGGSLSSSGARKLLPPSCPARFDYERTNPPAPRAVFDFGHAAHQMILGAGAPIVVVDAADWRTKAAREQRDQAHADGHTPMLAADYEQVVAMAAALLDHPIASTLLRPDSGRPEQSLFWIDRETGVSCRARPDWLPNTGPVRLIVPDYKTTKSAAPDDIQRAISTYGYHQQAPWYLDAIRACGLADDPQFVFIFQEKDAPYLVTVAQPDPTALRIGAHLNREARHLYRECVTAGRWPGYSDDVVLTPLPAYIENRYAKEIW